MKNWWLLSSFVVLVACHKKVVPNASETLKNEEIVEQEAPIDKKREMPKPGTENPDSLNIEKMRKTKEKQSSPQDNNQEKPK